jgi:hypothetical protein
MTYVITQLCIDVKGAVPGEWSEFVELDRRWNTGDAAENDGRTNEIQPPAQVE